MEDKDENQINNQDDFEFEKYPDDEDISLNDNNSQDKSNDEEYEEFEKYPEGEEPSYKYIPISSINQNEEISEDKVNEKKEDNQQEEVSKIHIDKKEKERISAIRARIKEEKIHKQKEQEQKRRNMKITLIVFGSLLFIIWLVYYSVTDIMPEYLVNQGKKYIAIKEYKKAINLFRMAGNMKPYDDIPVYYQVLALSKMPLTYENQKALYDISQLEDFDKASNYADDILTNIRKQIDKKIGSNYIDNVLYDDILFRWNTSEPINYFIFNNSNASKEYVDTLRSAFSMWSTASNGEISFRESMSSSNADIVINLLNNSNMKNNDNINQSGSVKPIIKDDVLQKVEIELKTNYPDGKKYDLGSFKIVSQHEIGHALGLWGHSSNPNDIMYYSGDYINAVNPNRSFSKRDINTLNLLYKMVPDVINKPISEKEYDNLFYHYIITTFPGENFELEMQRVIHSLKNDIRNIPAWVDLAINYGIKKQYKRSNTILKGILPLSKNNSQFRYVILYNMAANFYKMKDYSSAEKILKMAKIYDEDIDTQILEAFIDLKLNRKDMGKEKLILLNKKHPDHIQIALKLAQIYYFDREKSKAKEIINTLIKTNSSANRDRQVQKYNRYLMK